MKEKIINYVKENYREVVIICCITLCALILRLIMIKNFGELELDEMFSWYFANQKNVFATVIELIKQDLHMPLYFVILHFWIKLFGQSDTSMHLCTLVVSLPLIPLSYYAMKSLFDKETGYFAAMMFAINTFCIYYSTEVRFYGMVFVLALTTAFLFAKMVENFDKKYTVAFLISHSLLVYTFAITPLLTLFYAIVGFVYLLNKNSEKIKPFLKNIGIAYAIAIPSIICTIYNFVVMRSNLCSFTKDIYIFDWKLIYDILENYFSSENLQIVTGATNVYRNLFVNLQNPFYAIFVAIPIIIGVAGFVRALLSKNEKLSLFLFPSLLFLMFSILLGATGVFSFLTRYTAVIYPIIICATCFGLSQIRPKVVGFLLISVFVLLNYAYLYINPVNVLTTPRAGLSPLTKLMSEQIKPKEDDLLLIPYSGSRVMRYIPNGKLIHFNADDGLLLKDRVSSAFYFDEKYYNLLNRKNIRNILYPYIGAGVPFELYEIILRDFEIDNMKKGQRLIIISYRDSFTKPVVEIMKNSNKVDIYEKISMFSFLMSKITYDSLYIAKKYLKPLNTYEDKQNDFSVYVYEKE